MRLRCLHKQLIRQSRFKRERTQRITLMNGSTTKLLIAVSALCLSSLGAPAQTQSPPAQPDQRLLRFNIIVTDRAGRSVETVRKEDLQLLDDGNPETISYFSK